MSLLTRWTPRTHTARCVLAVAAVLALTPVAAAATGLDDDPQPTNWPVIAEPRDANSGQSDPRPLNPPTVAEPAQGEGIDPAPPDWPAPVEQ